MKKPFVILLISLFIFVLSLPFVAVYTTNTEVYGLACFLLGWAEMKGGGIAWMANPVLFIAAFFLLGKQLKISAVLSLIAAGLTFCFLSVQTITVDEAGHQYPITGYGAAYFLWIASAFSLFIGNIILLRSPGKTSEPI
ncbi:hypothetical protein [Chryseobacterium pennipullorum]|uniref:Uncharacterized protein n=1 Tax=Chryseobacterium pennipullorum TaxID=2258963 RepID=A0A3D9B6P8_9FLAO|nr:hypothetical protein [Chryseobacterium pennipullorum]REC49057.1 hypothetical protein DRF67_05760 [Chryseobacterium pennipullorum]